jgi:hypothetical protein
MPKDNKIGWIAWIALIILLGIALNSLASI